MEELLKKIEGSSAGPTSTSRFQTVIELYKTDENDTGIFVKTRHYIYCIAGSSDFGYASTSWGKTVVLGRTGQIYADTGIVGGEWIPYDSSKSYTAESHYTGGSGTRYQSNATGTLDTGPKPAPKTFTVTYNANGGLGAPEAQSGNVEDGVTISTVIPTRTGYQFLGWFDRATDGTQYSGLYKGPDITLYAHWKANEYTVQYNANGGSGAPASQIKTYGQTLILSSTIPTRRNYEFLGWTTKTTVEYQPGAEFKLNQNTILIAVWKLKANAYVKTSTGWKPAMAYAKTSSGWKLTAVKAKTSNGWKDTGL